MIGCLTETISKKLTFDCCLSIVRKTKNVEIFCRYLFGRFMENLISFNFLPYRREVSRDIKKERSYGEC